MIPGNFATRKFFEKFGAGTLKEMLLSTDRVEYVKYSEAKRKFNAEYILKNIKYECYREIMVSFIPMMPLLTSPQVRLSEADFILYMSPYARCDDVSQKALEEIKEIDKKRKKGAKIVICGKAANLERIINGSIPNILYYGDHYAEKVGKLLDARIGEEYFVYDDKEKHLAFWPVDGCLNKCKFCRRSYMDIKFESIPLDYIAERLDEFKKNHPEQMKLVSLRAENIAEYGIDIYGKPMLHELIKLLDSYDEIEAINIPLGLCIGEITDELLEAILKCKKINHIQMNPEVGTNRMLQFIGKKHSREDATRVFNLIREAHPDIKLSSTVMIGLPTETEEDIKELARLIGEIKIDVLHVNFFVVAPRQPLAQYPQLSFEETENHLRILLSELPLHLTRDLLVDHNMLFDSVQRKTHKVKKAFQQLKKINETSLFPQHFIEFRKWDYSNQKWEIQSR